MVSVERLEPVTDGGLNVAPAPGGRPSTDSAMLPEKSGVGSTVTENTPLLPGVRFCASGDAPTKKVFESELIHWVTSAMSLVSVRFESSGGIWRELPDPRSRVEMRVSSTELDGASGVMMWLAGSPR